MSVGIIANPASGKDIRRLVAHGSVFDNQEKVRMVRRALVGLAEAGVKDVFYMPEGYAIVPRAMDDLEASELPVNVAPVDMRLDNSQEDSIKAAALMEEAGVKVIITLGGDGTNRAVIKGARNTPVMPLSTGTNNVFPVMVEATVAGLAAGIIGTGAVTQEEGCYKACLLEILVNDAVRDMALVDIAVYDDVFVASRAVWDMERVSQLFYSRCKPDSIGLSSVGGFVAPITAKSERDEDARGLVLTLNAHAECRLRAAIGPGLFSTIGIDAATIMVPGKEYAITLTPSILAVDGEREVLVRREDRASVRLIPHGVRIVDIARTMHLAYERNLFSVGTKNSASLLQSS